MTRRAATSRSQQLQQTIRKTRWIVACRRTGSCSPISASIELSSILVVSSTHLLIMIGNVAANERRDRAAATCGVAAFATTSRSPRLVSSGSIRRRRAELKRAFAICARTSCKQAATRPQKHNFESATRRSASLSSASSSSADERIANATIVVKMAANHMRSCNRALVRDINISLRQSTSQIDDDNRAMRRTDDCSLDPTTDECREKAPTTRSAQFGRSCR